MFEQQVYQREVWQDGKLYVQFGLQVEEAGVIHWQRLMQPVMDPGLELKEFKIGTFKGLDTSPV